MASKDNSHDEIAESLRAMNIDEDLAWVLDSLIGFLKSPIWTTSLNNFVDQNSVVFEPEAIESNNGKIRVLPEYEKIFDEYRSLVDRLITTHMTELGIDEKSFAMACEMADGILAGRLKAVLFEELWAAENYEVFTRWMAKRNVELQLETLNTLAAKYGMVYDVFVPFDSDSQDVLAIKKKDSINIDKFPCENVKSIKNFSDNSKQNNENNEQSNSVKLKDERKLSQQIEVEAEVIDFHKENILDKSELEQERIENDKNRLKEFRDRVDNQIQESLLTILKSSPESGTEIQQIKSKDENEVENENISSINVINKKDEENKEENDNEEKQEKEKQQIGIKQLLTEQSESFDQRAKSVEIEKRAEYLRSQRDKIIALRAKERKEHITKYIKVKEKEASNSTIDVTNKNSSKESKLGKSINLSLDTETPNPELAYRKSLAARLKAEIGGFSREK